MGFVVFEHKRYDPAATGRRFRKLRPPPGTCPVCDTPLLDKPPSQRRRYCSVQCAGVAKRGMILVQPPSEAR